MRVSDVGTCYFWFAFWINVTFEKDITWLHIWITAFKFPIALKTNMIREIVGYWFL